MAVIIENQLMKLYRSLYIILFLFFALTTVAQQTDIYKDPLLIYKQAQEYYRLGNYPLAQERFSEALEFENKNTQVFSKVHQIDAAYHKAICSKHLSKEDAPYLLTKFIEEHGNNRLYNSLANYQLGELFYNKRNYRGALSCFEEIYEDDLSSFDYEHFKFIQAYSHFNLKQFDEAYDYFSKVSRMKGQHFVDASYYMGYLAFEKGDYDNAVQNFLVIEQEDRYRNILPYYITQIYYKQGKGDKILSYTIPKLDQSGLKYKTQMNKIVGQTFYDRKQFDRALPYLAYYVEYSNKVSKEDLYLLAYTQYQFGQYDKAIENFLELNTLKDNFGQNAAYHLADCYIKVGDKEKARTAFQQASRMEADPEIKRIAAFNHAKLSYELGLQGEAISSIIEFINVYPSAPETNASKSILADLLGQTNNYSKAIEIIETIPNKNESLKKTYQRACYAKAVELYNSGQATPAMQHFEKAQIYQIDSKLSGLTHYWKGHLFYNQGDFITSESSFKKYLQNPVQTATANAGIANYTIGYIYYTQKKYKDAGGYFAKAMSGLSSNQKIYSDAVLRSGDCAFINRDYSSAKKRYKEVIKKNMEGIDYAIYQNGMIAGLQQNYAEKIKVLNGLSKNYPKSYYSDDAVYQIAVTQAFQQKYNESIMSLQKLVEQYPDSKYYRQALSDLGVMYYNIEEYSASIIYYDKLIKDYPNSPEAQEAVFNLKEVYMAMGDSDAYFDYIEESPDIEISTSGQDTIMYQFAESFYEKGECLKAVGEFDKYLRANPQGAFRLYAHFYRGDCLYQKKRYSQASKDFDYVVKQKANMFSEKALMRGARIAFVINKNDEKAFQYYKKLLGIASQPEITTEALKGLTKSGYSLGNDDAVEKYGKKLLSDRRASANDKLEANFFLAKIAYKKNDLTNAQQTFKSVAEKSTNEIGAEARYLLAEILFKQNKLEEAKTASFRVDRETPEQEYWVVKAFVLLGDIYAKKGDLYQAKQTLQSIVENYSGDEDLLAYAKNKLQNIIAQEKAGSKLEDENDEAGQLELDEDN